jgi:hypothetical protein
MAEGLDLLGRVTGSRPDAVMLAKPTTQAVHGPGAQLVGHRQPRRDASGANTSRKARHHLA